jgi:hypothetical protein
MHEPPQSTPVSSPFFTLSVHEGATQMSIAEHEPLVQSVPILHAAPTPHGGHMPPPQSAPVSAPF